MKSASGFRFSVAIIAALLALPVQAEITAEVPDAISNFERACLSGGNDPAARPAALKAMGWKEDSEVTVDVPKLAISKTIDPNYDFSKPDKIDQWSGVINGRPARIVLASFPTKRRYPNLCALVIDDISNAMGYTDALKVAFKNFGIGGKSVDLVHYFEYAGKIGADKHPVRGEIFTRSLASGADHSMHIYVAY